MKVFISWSGDASREIALLLRKYLRVILQHVRPFMSRHDIESGSRWAERIRTELEETSYGLLVLTPSNLDARWLLFEAGALSKLKNSVTACLLCSGVKDTDVNWPLAQFQFTKFDQDPFFKLVHDMNSATPFPLEDESLDMVLEKWWGELKKEYDAILKAHEGKEPADKPRSEMDFQDEVLRTLRSLQKVEGLDYERHLSESLQRMSFLVPKEHATVVEEMIYATTNVSVLSKVAKGKDVHFICAGEVETINNLAHRIAEKIKLPKR